MYIPKIVCAPCGCAMEIDKNGVIVEMLALERPYYKIEGDRYLCPRCGAVAVTGFARLAVAEHYEEGYGAIESDHRVELS